MSATGVQLLSDARRTIERRLRARPQRGLSIVFHYWLMRSEAQASEARASAEESVKKSGALQDFQTVAQLGFALDAGLAEPANSQVLKAGLERLAGREAYIDGSPMPFCSDAVGILGVAIGTIWLGNAEVKAKIVRWMSGFLPSASAIPGAEDWQRVIYHAADCVLGSKFRIPEPESANIADVRCALTDRKIPFMRKYDPDTEDSSVLELTIRDRVEDLSFERAAIRLSAFEFVTRTAATVVPNRLNVRDVVVVLRHTLPGLRRWTWEEIAKTKGGSPRKWYVDHEYHVQNLLWLMLAPIFPDLDDEQYLTKIGQKSPRADLCIPSMRLIIEVKFLRKRDPIQKLIDEIASDTSLYLAKGNDFDSIVPFIWDNEARTNEHEYLSRGLKKLHGISDVVIVTRPSNWKSDT